MGGGETRMSLTKWIPSVGLEIHAQIISKSKLFSGGCANVIGNKPNTSVAFFDVALPGSLPVLNESCVKAGVLTALAVGAHVNMTSFFDRKHYFYPDLPSGYQITQKRVPLAMGGSLLIPLSHDKGHSSLDIRFKQLQLEQDSGKITYGEPVAGSNRGKETLVDYNRAGVALMEMVTEPDMSNGKEAAAFVKELRKLLQALGTCDGNMEDGSMRIDANVSVRDSDSAPLGIRTEIKNINGIKSLAKAIDYEIGRHIEVLENNGEIQQETRSFNEQKCITIATRGKTKQQDYCFMAEHDLPPIVLYSDSAPIETPNKTTPTSQAINIDRLLEAMPELPSQTRTRFISDYGLTEHQVEVLMGRDHVALFFEEVHRHCSGHSVSPYLIWSWITTTLYSLLDETNIELNKSSLTVEQMVSLIKLISDGTIVREQGKKILRMMLQGDDRLAGDICDDMSIVREEGLRVVCVKIIHSYPQQVAEYQSGKVKLLAFLVGQAMKEIGRNGDPKKVKALLLEEIQKL